MRLRPTLSAAILTSSLLCASLFLMAADDSHPPQPANPEYAEWAHFKPGTYVTLERRVFEHGENNVGVVEAMAHPPGASVMRINTKMVDLDKDKAVLEETRIDLGDGSETQMPADKVTLFASGAGQQRERYNVGAFKAANRQGNGGRRGIDRNGQQAQDSLGRDLNQDRQ